MVFPKKTDPYNLRGRIVTLGVQNTDVIREMKARGMTISAAQMSRAITNVEKFPLDLEILRIADEIVTEWEREAAAAEALRPATEHLPRASHL